MNNPEPELRYPATKPVIHLLDADPPGAAQPGGSSLKAFEGLLNGHFERLGLRWPLRVAILLELFGARSPAELTADQQQGSLVKLRRLKTRAQVLSWLETGTYPLPPTVQPPTPLDAEDI